MQRRTNIPKLEDDANNLFEPVRGYDTAKGDYSDKTFPSLSDWLEMNPVVKWGAIAGLGAVALLATGLFRDNNSI